MKIIIHYDGKTWRSGEMTNPMAEDQMDKFYDNLAEANKFRMYLEDGGYILLPKEAIQRSVIEIRP